MSYSALHPLWTKRVATESGRDPLGLSRLGDALKDYLLSGINSNNNRARYYSFYCWALWHIAREEQPANEEVFKTAFRRREAAMAIATKLDAPSSSPIGVKAVGPKLDEGRQRGRFDCGFRVLPASTLGGYGQDYAGSLHRLGLAYRPEGAPHDLVPEGKAEELAMAFHSVVEGTLYITKSRFRERWLEVSELEQTSKFLSLEALAQPFCARERELLTALLFDLGSKRPTPRSGSLCLLLHAIEEYERHGVLPVAKGLDVYLLYAFYYKSLWLDEECQPYRPPDQLTLVCDWWGQFCLHQFLTQALEYLLCAILEVITTDPNGLPLAEIIRRLIDKEFRGTLHDILGQSCGRPKHLMTAIGVDAQPTESVSRRLQRELVPTHRYCEAQLLIEEWGGPGRQAAIALALLSTLYGKWRGIEDATVDTRVYGGALCAGPVLISLDRWLDPALSWEIALSELVERFIIRQHERVWLEKHNIESRWLDWSDGRIRKEQDYTPLWRSSRHASAVNVMADLGLIKISQGRELSVTPLGQQILKKALTLDHGTY